MGVAGFGVVFEALGALSAFTGQTAVSGHLTGFDHASHATIDGRRSRSFGATVQRDCQDRSHQSRSDDFEDRIEERDGESEIIDS